VQGRRGHVVWVVDPNSPAEVGHLRVGYQVLEVNQEYVDNMEFPEVPGSSVSASSLWHYGFTASRTARLSGRKVLIDTQA